MSRRRSRRQSRCIDCNKPVRFFRSTVTGSWRPFDPRPVSPGQQLAAPAWVIENNVHAWPYRDLVEDLMVRHQCSRADAEEEAHAMAWHLPHRCPTRTETQEPLT